MLGERASKKFSEYSKIFTVDGNLSSGKGKLAQHIADKLGMALFSLLWGRAAGRLCRRNGSEGVGQQQAECEPTVCLGGQEGQWHPGLCQI